MIVVEGMTVSIVKWVGWAGVVVSGILFGFVNQTAGFWALMVGYSGWHFAVVHQRYKESMNYLNDRHAAHARLVEKGDYVWVMDQLAHIADRDDLPADLKADTRRLQTKARQLEPLRKAMDTISITPPTNKDSGGN